MDFNFARNYFELFGLEAQFHFDRDQLTDGYQALQSQFHPDRYIDANDQDKRVAMQATTFINEAYKTLQEEPSRARYMLELQNVPFNAEKDTIPKLVVCFLAILELTKERLIRINQQEPCSPIYLQRENS